MDAETASKIAALNPGSTLYLVDPYTLSIEEREILKITPKRIFTLWPGRGPNEEWKTDAPLRDGAVCAKLYLDRRQLGFATRVDALRSVARSARSRAESARDTATRMDALAAQSDRDALAAELRGEPS